MTHRDRVITALNHETPDRPPFQATFTPEFAGRLRKHFGLPEKFSEPHHREWHGYDLELLTGHDALQAGAGWFTNYYLKNEPYTDAWGVKWKIDSYDTPFGPGAYTNLNGGPLAGDSPDIDNYKAPDPNAPGLYAHVERLVREHKNEHYIIGRVHCCVFESAWALRGFENLLMDLYEEPERAARLLDITMNHHLAVAANMARRGVDMIWLGDDFGVQTSMLISSAKWNEVFKPRYAAMCAAIKNIDPGIKIAFHSDGCVYDIIPGLIEAGVDVLNPVQTECMDPARLKKQYGKNLCFFGGIAVQTTLPRGTPQQIRDEYAWLKTTLGAAGGWICAPTHHIQQDTPVANYLELAKCATENAAAG